MNILKPIKKQNLADNLAEKIRDYIESNNFVSDDKLPSNSKMAELFEVGIPTIREALKKLETLGFVVIKHGSGVFVGKYFDNLFMPNPIIKDIDINKKKLLEMLDIREILEAKMFLSAVNNITSQNIEKIDKILRVAEHNTDDYKSYGNSFKEIYNVIGDSSDNSVLKEILMTLTSFFTDEQQNILRYNLHLGEDYILQKQIYEAVKQGDKDTLVKLLNIRLNMIRSIINSKL